MLEEAITYGLLIAISIPVLVTNIVGGIDFGPSGTLCALMIGLGVVGLTQRWRHHALPPSRVVQHRLGD